MARWRLLRIAVVASLSAAALMAGLPTRARAGDAPPLAAGPLVVAVPPGLGPVAAFDRALFAEVAREAGLDATFTVAAPEAALADLDAGRVDVAAGPYPPEAARGRRALDAVLLRGDALLKRRGDGSLREPAAVAGKRLDLIGPPADAARLKAEASSLRARIARHLGGFAPDPEGDLAAGRLAALLGALPEVAAAALSRPDAFEVVGPPVGPTAALAPLMRADRIDRAAGVAGALGRLRADGRLAALQRRWFGLAFDPPGAAPPQPSPVSTSKP